MNFDPDNYVCSADGEDCSVVGRAKYIRDSVRKLSFDGNVRSIRQGVFDGCPELEEVTFPDSLLEIGVEAFNDCPRLKCISFGKNLLKIGGRAFAGCATLAEMELPPMLSVIGDCAFSGCKGLTDVILPKSLRQIGRDAFDRCDSLRKVTICSDIDTNCWIPGGWCYPGYVYRGHNTGDRPVFSNCRGLEQIVVTEGVTRLPGKLLEECAAVKGLVLPDSCVEAPPDLVTRFPQYRGGVRYAAGGTVLANVVALHDDCEVPDAITTISRGSLIGCDLSRFRFQSTSRLKKVHSGAIHGCKGVLLLPPSLRVFDDRNSAKHVLLPYGCASHANDESRRYHEDDYALVVQCIDDARAAVSAKRFDVRNFISVVDRFMSVRMTVSGFDRMQTFLEMLPKLSRLQTADAFYGVDEADFGRYLDIVLAKAGNLRRSGGLVRFAAEVLHDDRGKASPGRTRRLALIRRLMPGEGIDCPRGRTVRECEKAWPLLTEAGLFAAGDKCEAEFQRWKSVACNMGFRMYYDNDDGLDEAIRKDAVSRFMIRLDLLAREPTPSLVGALIAAGAFGCLYELQRTRGVAAGMPAIGTILTSACDLGEETCVRSFLSLLRSHGEEPWKTSKSSGGFGFLWHALVGRSDQSKDNLVLGNALTDALIASGCDPHEDCFCGFSFNELISAPVVGGDWERNAAAALEWPVVVDQPAQSKHGKTPAAATVIPVKMPRPERMLSASARPIPANVCRDAFEWTDENGDIPNWSHVEMHGVSRMWIPKSVKSIGNFAFKGCADLEEVYFDPDDGYPLDIGTMAFADCPKLRKVMLPGRLRSIGAGAFRDNPSLAELTIDPGDASLHLGGNVFANCPNPAALRNVLDNENQYR